MTDDPLERPPLAAAERSGLNDGHAVAELRLAVLVVDSQAYHNWAGQIAAGDWVGHGVFYQAPLYPYFLAVIYKIAGPSVAASVQTGSS